MRRPDIPTHVVKIVHNLRGFGLYICSSDVGTAYSYEHAVGIIWIASPAFTTPAGGSMSQPVFVLSDHCQVHASDAGFHPRCPRPNHCTDSIPLGYFHTSVFWGLSWCSKMTYRRMSSNSDLRFNRIREINSDILQKLTNLQTLLLNNNEIRRISQRSFKALGELKHL
ncbi:unnamed protein product [Ranitomeya imitator]|uniref:Uncharacterized protein n=1 Tax=Ranitomeya imitator TaxID=111125 RepID=A0ABN9KV53_9NEOB|nr:unnamed protein product [Ranitomeya imitator]